MLCVGAICGLYKSLFETERSVSLIMHNTINERLSLILKLFGANSYRNVAKFIHCKE